MRSRYTAFTQGNSDYLLKTMKGDPLKHFNAEQVGKWSKSVEWMGLEVYNSSIDVKNPNRGTVHFKASFKENNQLQAIEENSLFSKINDRWFYIGSVTSKSSPNSKQGRNDPCRCGSGIKYKKCCGASGN